MSDGDPAADARVDADAGAWQVQFDGAAEPSRTHAVEALPDAPVGTVAAAPIAAGEAPRSQAALRALPGGQGDTVDPLDSPLYTVDAYVERDDGDFWGNRITVTIDLDEGSVRITQLKFLDDAGTRLHTLLIQCTVACYEANLEAIDSVIDSFTLED